MRRTAAALLIAFGLLAIPTTASATSDKAEIRSLRAQVERLKDSREVWRGRYQTAKTDLETATNQLELANGGITTLQGMVTALQGQLQVGLPGSIAAVDIGHMLSLVITPARDRWRAVGGCASTYTSGGYWSIDFTAPGYC